MTTTDWPTERGRHATLAAQFSTDRADLAGWALTTTDPLADTVMADAQAQHQQAAEETAYEHLATTG